MTNRGYTILEMLIVLLIMALLIGLGLANYRDYQKNQSIKAEASNFESSLRYAQELALSGSRSSSCPLNYAYEGVIFQLLTNKSYRTSLICANHSVIPTLYNYPIISTVTLTSPVNIAPTGQNISFYAVGKGNSIAAGSSLNFTICESGRGYGVSVSASGLVDLNDSITCP